MKHLTKTIVLVGAMVAGMSWSVSANDFKELIDKVCVVREVGTGAIRSYTLPDIETLRIVFTGEAEGSLWHLFHQKTASSEPGAGDFVSLDDVPVIEPGKALQELATALEDFVLTLRKDYSRLVNQNRGELAMFTAFSADETDPVSQLVVKVNGGSAMLTTLNKILQRTSERRTASTGGAGAAGLDDAFVSLDEDGEKEGPKKRNRATASVEDVSGTITAAEEAAYRKAQARVVRPVPGLPVEAKCAAAGLVLLGCSLALDYYGGKEISTGADAVLWVTLKGAACGIVYRLGKRSVQGICSGYNALANKLWRSKKK